MNLLIVLALPWAICTTGAGADVRAQESHNPVPAHAVAAGSDSLRAVYEGALGWAEFFQAVERRRDLWIRNWTHATVPADLLERARRIVGRWRIMVITEPGCSDSANSVPFLSRLVEETPSLELRLVNSTVGRPWLEAHRSPDGRAATPTVLVLDEDFGIRGCWVEQPQALQTIWLPIVARGTMAEEIETKMAWYEADAGRETLRELVEVLEAAQSGNTVCPGLEQVARLHPLDEAAAQPEFATFRVNVVRAIEARDTSFLYSILAQDILNSFGGDGGPSEFREMWTPDEHDSPVWTILADVVKRGGAFEDDSTFVAPYTFSRFPDHLDGFAHLVVTGADVSVRAGPDVQARIIATLSFDIVEVAGTGESAAQHEGWSAVRLADGKTGFISSEYVKSPLDYRAVFVRRAGRWLLRALVAGD